MKTYLWFENQNKNDKIGIFFTQMQEILIKKQNGFKNKIEKH